MGSSTRSAPPVWTVDHCWRSPSRSVHPLLAGTHPGSRPSRMPGGPDRDCARRGGAAGSACVRVRGARGEGQAFSLSLIHI
eukprot:5459199-Prymnesium_polylepis.1